MSFNIKFQFKLKGCTVGQKIQTTQILMGPKQAETNQ